MNNYRQKSLKVFFDGGCRPNPGAMECAVVLRGVTDVRRSLGYGTSDEAEWLALVTAVEIAGREGVRDVILIGDALSVIRQANGAERCHSDVTSIWLTRFQVAVRQFDRVRLRHVRRTQNLAGIALERARWHEAA